MAITFIATSGATWFPLMVATCKGCGHPVWLGDGFYLRFAGVILDSEFYHAACAPDANELAGTH
jgi:hypothetical protein